VVELRGGPGGGLRVDAEGGGELWECAVVPGYEDDLAGVLAAEKEFGEGGVVIVDVGGIDGEVESFGQRLDGLEGAVGVPAEVGGEEGVRARKYGFGAEEELGEIFGAGEAFGGEIDTAVGELFGVAEEQDGGGGLGFDRRDDAEEQKEKAERRQQFTPRPRQYGCEEWGARAFGDDRGDGAIAGAEVHGSRMTDVCRFFVNEARIDWGVSIDDHYSPK
jgi:hypothetical protein